MLQPYLAKSLQGLLLRTAKQKWQHKTFDVRGRLAYKTILRNGRFNIVGKRHYVILCFSPFCESINNISINVFISILRTNIIQWLKCFNVLIIFNTMLWKPVWECLSLCEKLIAWSYNHGMGWRIPRTIIVKWCHVLQVGRRMPCDD